MTTIAYGRNRTLGRLPLGTALRVVLTTEVHKRRTYYIATLLSRRPDAAYWREHGAIACQPDLTSTMEVVVDVILARKHWTRETWRFSRAFRRFWPRAFRCAA